MEKLIKVGIKSVVFISLFPGYGGISPRTQWGRVAALVYALFGIPIVLLYLSAMGG